METKKGYVHVYTGNGKGKTTAALGLALRAVGAGERVLIVQFIKGTPCGEHDSINKLNGLITLKQYGRGSFIFERPNPQDLQVAQEGLREVKDLMQSNRYQMVILDEANIATHYNLFSVEDLLDVIESKPEGVELVITGRYADPRIIERADFVTDMREIKHYYRIGVKAREGIEL